LPFLPSLISMGVPHFGHLNLGSATPRLVSLGDLLLGLHVLVERLIELVTGSSYIRALAVGDLVELVFHVGGE
jgi:hypothetical protein